jgi:hypothetical protein
MAEQRLHASSDAELEAALRALAPVVAWPSAGDPASGADLAAVVRTRIQAVPARAGAFPNAARPVWPRGLSWRPARRAVIAALIALLAVAAIAGAIGLGLPGLRITLEPIPATPPPSARPSSVTSGAPTPRALGASMRLGEAMDAHDATALDARAGFHVRWPADPAVGPPEAAFIDNQKGGQVTLLWPTRPGLPVTLEPGVGLLMSEFQGSVDTGFFEKAAGANTIVERVQVAGNDGFWLHGDPHIFFWQGPDGFVDDSRRWVGDVLLWSDGPITYRLETSLGRDEAVRIAETMP